MSQAASNTVRVCDGFRKRGCTRRQSTIGQYFIFWLINVAFMFYSPHLWRRPLPNAVVCFSFLLWILCLKICWEVRSLLFYMAILSFSPSQNTNEGIVPLTGFHHSSDIFKAVWHSL